MERKQTKAPDNYPKKEDLSQYKESQTFSLFEGPSAGVLSMDVFGDDFVLSGGKNGETILFDVGN